MKEKRIDVIKAKPKLKSVQDIQVFIAFANFYQRFIEGFSKIAALFTSLLKVCPLLASALLATDVDNNKVVDSSGKNDKKSAKFDFIKPVHKVKKPSFLTPNTRQAFT